MFFSMCFCKIKKNKQSTKVGWFLIKRLFDSRLICLISFFLLTSRNLLQLLTFFYQMPSFGQDCVTQCLFSCLHGTLSLSSFLCRSPLQLCHLDTSPRSSRGYSSPSTLCTKRWGLSPWNCPAGNFLLAAYSLHWRLGPNSIWDLR